MSDAFPPPPLPGDRVGPYLLVRALGVGGMATVYEAHTPQGEPIAVKILHPGRAGTPEERLFRREVQALQSMDHPGVVRVLGAGREGAYPWMAMELVDGTDLGRLLERWRANPPPDRLTRAEAIFRGLCEALGAVHARGIIHRDLKPSNVLVTQEGAVKLADFGFVGIQGVAPLPQQTLVGTLAFMSPEQILGRPTDSRSDLYALGAVLYTLLTGSLPLEADSVAGYLERQVQERPRPPSELDPRVPPALERVCMRLLEKDPALRYASARQALAALDLPERAPPTELRGREALLARLLARVGELAQGRGGLVVVSGPPGSGRSALLAELARRARSRGQDVALCTDERADPISVLGDQLPDLGDSLAPRGDAAGRLIHRAHGLPWALLIDDLDELTPDALAALTVLVRERVAVEGDPLLFVVSVVDPAGMPFCTGEFTGLNAEIVTVGPLLEADVVALIQDQGVPGASARPLGRRLSQEGLGSPGAVLACLASMEQAGWLVRAEAGGLLPARGLEWTEDQPLPGEAPQAPWQELRGPAREVAELLAALEGEAPFSLLLEVGGERARVGVSGLEALGLVACEVDADDAGGSVRVLDGSALSALARNLQPDHRRALHASLAATLQRWAPRNGRWVPILADQLQRAGQTAQAWPLLVEAAQLKLKQRRPDEAWRWLRRAAEARGSAEPGLDLGLRELTRERLFATQAELLEGQGAWAQAEEAWGRAEQSARARGDQVARALALSGLGRALAAMGEHARALPALREGLLGLSPGDAPWLSTTRALAGAAAATGQEQAAVAAWTAVIDVAREIGLNEDLRLAEAALEALTSPVKDTLAADR